MATISFTRSAKGVYVGTITATENFNLHVEGNGAPFSVWQKIDGATSYSKIAECDGVFDRDIVGSVWPKSIMIESEKEPVEAIYKGESE